MRLMILICLSDGAAMNSITPIQPVSDCRCWRCIEAEKREQLEAVKRAIAQFEPKKEK